MTMAQLRTAADWLRVLDQAEDWLGSFRDHAKKPFINFSDIMETTQLDGMGEGSGWDGQLIVPRDVAVEMMEGLVKRARDELAKLGVEK